MTVVHLIASFLLLSPAFGFNLDSEESHQAMEMAIEEMKKNHPEIDVEELLSGMDPTQIAKNFPMPGGDVTKGKEDTKPDLSVDTAWWEAYENKCGACRLVCE